MKGLDLPESRAISSLRAAEEDGSMLVVVPVRKVKGVLSAPSDRLASLLTNLHNCWTCLNMGSSFNWVAVFQLHALHERSRTYNIQGTKTIHLMFYSSGKNRSSLMRKVHRIILSIYPGPLVHHREYAST